MESYQRTIGCLIWMAKSDRCGYIAPGLHVHMLEQPLCQNVAQSRGLLHVHAVANRRSILELCVYVLPCLLICIQLFGKENKPIHRNRN